MKKGLSYIDMAISVGIFAIYLIIAFIILKPSIKEENTASLLLPSLKNSFEKSVIWEIEKYPLFLYATDPNPYEIIVPFNFDSQKIDFVNKDIIVRDFYYQSFPVNGKQAFKILFQEPTPALNNTEPYYILYSDDFDKSHLLNPPAGISAPADSYNYTFGVKEEFIGISIQKINNLRSISDIKNTFRFPSNNDFSISIYDSNEMQILDFYTLIIPKDAKVYAIQYTSFILHQNSSRVPVFVQLKIW